MDVLREAEIRPLRPLPDGLYAFILQPAAVALGPEHGFDGFLVLRKVVVVSEL